MIPASPRNQDYTECHRHHLGICKVKNGGSREVCICSRFIFPFFQALIDSQKALAVQLQKQSEMIRRLVQKPIAQAMTTKRGTPSISATGDWYGQKEFEEARNSTANVPTHNTTKRPIAGDTLFKEPATKRPYDLPLSSREFTTRADFI